MLYYGNTSIQTQWRAIDGLTYRYAYDKTGNLVKDRSEEIAEIKWCASGKVKEIIRTQGSVLAVYERRSYHSGIDNYTPEQYYDYAV